MQRASLLREPPALAPSAIPAGPAASLWMCSRTRRVLDIAVALVVLTAAAVPMLAIALCIRLTSPGPALFTQKRVGRWGRLFSIYKFRSMVASSGASAGIGLTRSGDRRITPVGQWLRRLKLDELPQFINVLRGDMSLVGPRPKLPQYGSRFDLACRPGITGAATLAFRREEEILSRVYPEEVEAFYHRHIKPLKAKIDARYMRRATLRSDLRILAATLAGCFAPSRAPILLRRRPGHALGIHAVPLTESPAADLFSDSLPDSLSSPS